jgi:hypothetical protein
MFHGSSAFGHDGGASLGNNEASIGIARTGPAFARFFTAGTALQPCPGLIGE